MSQQSDVLKAYVTRFDPEPEKKKEDKVESTEPCSVEETSEEE